MTCYLKNIKLMLSMVMLGLTPLAFAETSVNYNNVDISGLQNQYQQQLKPKTPKKVMRKTSPARSQTSAQEIRLYQQLLARQQQTKQTQPKLRQQQRIQQPVQKQRQVQRPVKQAPQRVAPRRDAIFEAASSGNVTLIGRLLAQGANVNQANNERETALHMAAAKGHYSAVIYLLNHGANINARTINNWLPIHHATRFRHAQIANYLKQRGSSIHARTSDGLSAVDMAKAVNDRRILSIFGVR